MNYRLDVQIVSEDQNPSTYVRSVSEAVEIVKDLANKPKEHLVAMFFNARGKLIARDIVSIGTLTASLAHPREIFFSAIGKAAAYFILAHNHPSGNPAPSEEDLRLTKRIKQAGLILGIELQDHIIVGHGAVYSFKTAGLL